MWHSAHHDVRFHPGRSHPIKISLTFVDKNSGCQKPDATSRCVLAGGGTDTVNLQSICIPYITKVVDSKLYFIHLYKQSGRRLTLIFPVLRMFYVGYRLPLGPTKDSLISYTLSLFLKSCIYESQWKYQSILAWWRLYASWNTAPFPLWHIHWMKQIRHFDIFVTACIESCPMWRTYAYQIPYFIYIQMCVCVCLDGLGIIYIYIN